MNKFQLGDIVIKCTGGDKMTIFRLVNEKYECIWASDRMYQGIFSESELLPLSEYKKIEEREDRINTLLSL